MKCIEEKISSIFWAYAENPNLSPNERKVITLSCRDKVVCNGITIAYYLWDTCLVCLDCINNEFYFYPSSEGAKESTTVSKTTKSRLNAIFSHCFNISFSQKNYQLFLGNKKIDTDKKYRMIDDMNFEEIK